MKISTRGRYAVMAMADIAQQQAENAGNAKNAGNAGNAEGVSRLGRGKNRENGAGAGNAGSLPAPVSLSAIAKRQEIPLPYLEQIFQDLRGAALVESVRGAKGGYRLCRPPAQTLIGDIIASVDEVVEATRCKSTRSCLSKQGRCLTHDLWVALEGQIHNFLNHVSLADVVNGTCAVTAPALPRNKIVSRNKNNNRDENKDNENIANIKNVKNIKSVTDMETDMENADNITKRVVL